MSNSTAARDIIRDVIAAGTGTDPACAADEAVDSMNRAGLVMPDIPAGRAGCVFQDKKGLTGAIMDLNHATLEDITSIFAALVQMKMDHDEGKN